MLPLKQKIFGLSFFLFLALALIPAKPARACSPAPGSHPSSIAQRVEGSQYIFEGTVTQVQGNSVVIQVNEYFKGQGPKTITLIGFNQTSCDDFLSSGEHRLFFGEDNNQGSWNAVYDGAFGSTEPWSEEVQSQVEEIDWQVLSSPDSLPKSVAEAVERQVRENFGFDDASITIISAQKRTWPNGCLGLAFPNIACTEALVEGWLVNLTRDGIPLRYRSDRNGRVVFLENGVEAVPNSVKAAIFNQALPLLPVNINNVKLTQAFPRLWDGCLGIHYGGQQVCTSIGIPGWQVVLQEQGKTWVFHSNQNGSRLKINLTASKFNHGNPIQPKPISSSSTLPNGAVFRVVSLGGFAGRTKEVTLWSNGIIVTKSLNPNSNRGARFLRTRVTKEQVKEFQQLLTQQDFSNYDGQDFPPPEGSADFVTVNLISQDSSTSYSDINQDKLPKSLQTAIAAWQDLLSTAKPLPINR